MATQKKTTKMKEIILKVPESKFNFFMELFVELGLDISQNIEVSEEQKTLVRERIRKSKNDQNELLDWEDVKDNFKLD